MRLTTAASFQNTYTFKRPVTLDDKLTGYAKILLFLDKNDTSWNRLDLIKEALGLDLTGNRYENRGTMINIFATFRANDIVIYNKSDKTWSQGPKFELYLDTYLKNYR